MELGVSFFGDRHVDAQGRMTPAHQRLKEMIEEVKLMDETGLDFFGIGEHHRVEYAVSVPEIVLAAAATVTKNIKLGSAVSVLSSSDPVRLYQSFASVDGLSDGRAEMVVGRGSFTESFPLFGFELQDYNKLFEEKLELLLQINREVKINWKGSTRAALVNQEVYPRAIQEQLPVWIAVGGTPESVVRAAQYNLPIMFAIIGGAPAHFQPLFQYYYKALAHFGHPEAGGKTGVHMHCLFGDDSNQLAQEYFPQYASQMNRIGRDRGWQPYQRAQFEGGRSRNGALLIGDANEAIDKILYLHETLGFDRFAAHMDVGGPSHQTLMRSIEIFGTRIAPAVRKALASATASTNNIAPSAKSGAESKGSS